MASGNGWLIARSFLPGLLSWARSGGHDQIGDELLTQMACLDHALIPLSGPEWSHLGPFLAERHLWAALVPDTVLDGLPVYYLLPADMEDLPAEPGIAWVRRTLAARVRGDVWLIALATANPLLLPLVGKALGPGVSTVLLRQLNDIIRGDTVAQWAAQQDQAFLLRLIAAQWAAVEPVLAEAEQWAPVVPALTYRGLPVRSVHEQEELPSEPGIAWITRKLAERDDHVRKQTQERMRGPEHQLSDHDEES